MNSEVTKFHAETGTKNSTSPEVRPSTHTSVRLCKTQRLRRNSLALKSLYRVIQTSLFAFSERLVLLYVCNIFSNMLSWSHFSRTRDLMLKRDTTSSLNICCDIIRDIVQARSMLSLRFTRDVIQDITRILRKPWSLMDLGENLNNTLKGIIADVRLTQSTYWYAIITAYIALAPMIRVRTIHW